MESILHLLFLLQFLPLLSSSESYNPQVRYFMNCGSASKVDLVDPRIFVGDKNSNSSFSVGKSNSVQNENPLPGILPLYHTARIYTKISHYMLNITQSGSYLVRLHFFPFSFKKSHLADALFNVSASNFSLLSNFSVRNSSTEFPVIKEFFLKIAEGNFDIYFIPADETRFAFVNAIEAFLLPQKFFIDNLTAIPPLRTIDAALKTLYRINVGGPEINDSLWRNWVPDNDYLTFGSSEQASCNGEPKESRQRSVFKEIAPDDVYRTCKKVSIDTNRSSNIPNITWRFNVSKEARHLVRLHVCDFSSPSPGTVKFDLNISTNFSTVIDPNSDGFSDMSAPLFYDYNLAFQRDEVIDPTSDGYRETGTPLFYDYVVSSDDSGYMSFSIAPKQNSTKKVAFLNGLEIMEFVGNSTFEVPVEHETRKHIALKIGLAGGAALILVLILLLSVCLRLRRLKPIKALILKNEFLCGRGRSPSSTTKRTENASIVTNLNLKLKMSLVEILAATENFNPKLLIGEGGFGKVYKGTLESGKKVAVKRSDSSHGQGLPEFQTEIMVLSKIQHRHLVSLVGYCDEGLEMVLVYEFMENGSLRDHLYDRKECLKNPSVETAFTWKQRLEICIDSAKGLHYLHTGPDGGIFHRDVKSTNILLDEHYVAKVADFGLSQSGMPDPDHISMSLKGSFGYIDPEYFRTLQLTNKSDVYSFGVILLEVLCARPPIVNSKQREEINLAEWGMFWHKKGQLEKIIDPLLVGHINQNSLRKFGEITEKCLKPQGADRPNMLDVCWDLEYALQLQQTPAHREAHEDSTTIAASTDLALPPMRNSEL
ncbi:BINDING PROTEIN putative-RELATED [Salix purpurea]|uniref:BINDING PROTEIN putative-RELATED n=1 Tax=Salix purpurea TaxID=77065 RepID=A0A9Q1AKM3_SALPP|nr:BINDING PROTEIN putative-RELATED [Salix purpurea]